MGCGDTPHSSQVIMQKQGSINVFSDQLPEDGNGKMWSFNSFAFPSSHSHSHSHESSGTHGTDGNSQYNLISNDSDIPARRYS